MRKQTAKKLAVLALAGFAGLAAGARAQTTINGTVFADFSHRDNKDEATGTKSNDSGVGTDVKRFYFTATNTFDDVWSAQFQSDIGDKGAKRYDVFVKKAYIQAKASPELTFRLGSANTPWVPFVEEIYGYRYVEQELLDRLGFGTSADWGVHFLGAAGDGVVNYAAGVLNGRGYSDPTRSKNVDFEGRIGFQPVKGLNFAVGGYTGKRGLATNSVPALHTATRFDGLAAYSNDYFRIGGEYFKAKNWNSVTAVPTDKADGFSGWASIPLGPTFSAFGRVDSAKPSKDLKPKLKDTYYDAGLQAKVNRSFSASLVYKYEKVKGGTLSSGPAGTVGSINPASQGKFQEIGIFTVYSF
ncbi:MAG: carbohydrate porin [Acidobacteriota bacterium]|nr:carbohydrate porin [Acidobacteriota bacterium]